MATIRPFAALRPRPDLAARICQLPYDVMSSDEARQVAAGNPLSFLRVSKPEIELAPGTDACAPEAYAKARQNFDQLIARGVLRQDAQPCFYLYRQIMGRHTQVGLVAVASCDEYLTRVIRKHELTHPDKVDDRARHIDALSAQTGPAFLIYRAAPVLDDFINQRIAPLPDVDFTADDGVRHTAWTVGDAAGVQFVTHQFAQIPFLYIADGHHRSAAAARVWLERKEATPHPAGGHPRPSGPGEGRGEEPSATFLAVVFPHNQVQILPYNRGVKDLNGLSPAEWLRRVASVCAVRPGGDGFPSRKHECGLYLAGQWHTLTFPPALAESADPVARLDVTLLQTHLLSPLLAIADPRTSQRIHFVGGIRGPAELERLVNRGECACAFSLFPPSVEELMAVADAGERMPPKSTWFEPKLRDALFCHLI